MHDWRTKSTSSEADVIAKRTRRCGSVYLGVVALRQILSQLLLTAAWKNFGSNEIIGLLPSLERDEILRVVSNFNLLVLANETLSLSLCREIDNVFGDIRTCFDHVLSKFSGFSWERILF